MSPETKQKAKNRKKQERAKLRRQLRQVEKHVEQVYKIKPLEDWDLEELARGRQRALDGSFRGATPKYVSRSVHEEAVRRFTELAQSDMRALVPAALELVELIITDTRVDERGRLIYPAATKLDAAKWVVEHLVGKPTQRIEQDITVRLQAVLAQSLVQPGPDGSSVPAIDVHSWEQSDGDDVDDGLDEDGE